jgi:hypothetical protein
MEKNYIGKVAYVIPNVGLIDRPVSYTILIGVYAYWKYNNYYGILP